MTTGAPATPTFRAALTEAAAFGWSGVLAASAGGAEVGSAVLATGDLAWATCVYQPEDLGSFLYRLGHVTRRELDRVRVEYARLGGRRKLGRLLEEAGLVTRPVLRRCLLLHIRMALACLLRNDSLRAVFTEGAFSVEDELLFPLREALPESEGEAAAAGLRPTVTISAEETDAVLGRLESIGGYRGSLISRRDGQPIAVHGFTEEERSQTALLATTVVTLVDGALNTASWSGLGRVDYAYLEAEQGSVVAGWLDPERRTIVALFLDSAGKLGLAKHRMAALEEELRALVGVHGSGGG